MTPLPVMEAFDGALLELPALLRRIDARDPRIFEDAIDWLARAVRLAEDARLPLASELALIRGQLQVFTPPDSGRTGRRNARAAAVVDGLEQARGQIERHFATLRETSAQHQTLCRKTVAVARAAGLLPRLDDLNDVWARIAADARLLPALTETIGAVGVWNTRLLLDRALSETQEGIA